MSWVMLMMVSETCGDGIGLRNPFLLTQWRNFVKPNSIGYIFQWQRWLKITSERLINLGKQPCSLRWWFITYFEGGVEPSKLALKLKRFKFVAALTKNQLLPGTIADVSETMYGAPQTYYSDKGVFSATASSSLLNLELTC